MKQQPIEPNVALTPQINERLWQAWIWKNREQDKMLATKRLRFFQVVLAVVFAGATLQSLMK